MKSPCEGCHDYCDPNNRICVKLTTYKTTLAARDKEWVGGLYRPCPHQTPFEFAHECGLCMQSLKKDMGVSQ